jgi:predicted lactoylglutathione lyase
MPENQPVKIIGSAPLSLVADVVKAAEYYRDVLGFNYKGFWNEPPNFCMPSRNNFIVMLLNIESDSAVLPNGKIELDSSTWDAYSWIDDADKLFSEFKNKGAQIVYGPTIREYYSMKEFAVEDIDGHILAFGQHWDKRN